MGPTQELVDAIYKDRVRRARERPLSQKVLSGAELFEASCQRMDMGIRMQYPELDAASRLELIKQRLDRLRGIREAR